MKGKFITFEGCEGVGKSTQMKWLSEHLEKNNIPCIFTREPGGSAIAEKIRELILEPSHTDMSNVCEALLYSAARNQHLKDIVIPNMEQGINVICDRFTDSTFAYQGVGRGLGIEFIESLNKLSIENILPDATIFLDLHPREAFDRKGGRDSKDRLELMDMEFHERVYSGYKMLVERYPDRIIEIDASGEKKDTHKKVIEAVNKVLNI